MSNLTTIWSPERINRLRELAAQKLTGSKIAELFGNGMTRNGIASICARKGIKLSGRREKRQKAPKKDIIRRPPQKVFVPLAEVPVFQEISGSIPLIEAGLRSCRWPIGVPKEMRCCGADTVIAGESYCEAHKRISMP